MKFIITTLIMLLCLNSKLFGFGAPKNSKVEINYTSNNNDAKLTFKTIPNEGLVANFANAPWSLKFKKTDNISFVNKKLDVTKLDKKLPGFHASATVSKNKKVSFEYDMVAFVCTKDKTKCYRDSHKKSCIIKKNSINCLTRKKK